MLLDWLRKVAASGDGARLSMIDRSYAARLLRWLVEQAATPDVAADRPS